MKAELNERNEVVVTMSRGEAQRVAEVLDQFCAHSEDRARSNSAWDFVCCVLSHGIELWLQK